MAEAAEEGTRIEVARQVMAEVVRPANPELRAGLRLFGSGAVQTACEDTELIVPYAPSNQSTIASSLQDVQPGTSSDAALAEAMIAAIRDLSSSEGPHSLVIVTGGEDTCNPQAGELLAQEAERAGIDLQTYVVGFQLSDQAEEAIKGMIGDTPGTEFHTADNRSELKQVLEQVQGEIDQRAAAALAGTPPTGSESSGDDPDEDRPEPTQGAGGRTACDHPYFPLRQGAQWRYQGGEVPMAWSVDSVSGDQTNATALVTIDFGEGQLQYEWTCDSQGLHFYFSAINFAGETPGEITIETTSHGGPMLLSADQLEPGATWSSAFTTNVTTAVAGVEATMTVDTEQSHTAGEPTSVTVPAGTFEALPVTIEGTTSASGLGMNTGETSFTTTLWFGRDAGIVRIESSGMSGSYTQDLVSYTIP